MTADWPLDDVDFEREVCAALSSGRLLSHVLPEMGESEQRFWDLHAKSVTFRTAVAAARMMGVERLADEILTIADSMTDPRHRTVRIEARKWLLAKLLPRRYGDKVDVTMTTDKPINEMSDDELRARLAAIHAARLGRGDDDGVAAQVGGASDRSQLH